MNTVTQPEYGEANLYINGELRPANQQGVYNNIAPATGEVIGVAADAKLSDAEEAVMAARKAFDETDWAQNHDFRYEVLKRFEAQMREFLPQLKEAAVAEVGSTRFNAEGPQAAGPIDMVGWTLDYMNRFEWEKDIGEYTVTSLNTTSRRIVCKEAVGVVAAITPWNFPIQIILAKVIPALAAGCTVVLKAAPDTPWTASLFGRIAQAAGLPAGVLNILTAADPAEIGEYLTSTKDVDLVSFTGSTAVGKRIMANASATVKKVFLELGGKSPNVILDDADFGGALLSALAVCYHAGQGCVIATRLLVPKARLAETEDLIKTYFGFITFGDPDADGAIMGPLISERQRQRVDGMVKQALTEGGRLLLGGEIPTEPAQGFYYPPTAIVDEQGKTCVARDEVFGPVLTIIPYEDEVDALRIANDSDYGLGAMVSSADEQRAMAFARKLRCGIVNVNGGNFLAPDSPFGGYKQSGIGREMGEEGFAEYLETKTIAIGV